MLNLCVLVQQNRAPNQTVLFSVSLFTTVKLLNYPVKYARLANSSYISNISLTTHSYYIYANKTKEIPQ